jgi:LuxR family transcriptional regulator, quorum-sensing system regulator SolR
MSLFLREGHLELTAREIEVLKWIADGKSDWQIGQILSISDKTVNFHVENMKRKCGVATRMQVVVRAVHEGKIAPVQD